MSRRYPRRTQGRWRDLLAGLVLGAAICAAFAAAALASAYSERDLRALQAYEVREDLQDQLENCEEDGRRSEAIAALYRTRSHLAAALVEIQRGNPAWAAAETATAMDASFAAEVADTADDREELAAFRLALQDAIEWNSPGVIEDAIDRTDALLWSLDGEGERPRRMAPEGVEEQR